MPYIISITSILRFPLTPLNYSAVVRYNVVILPSPWVIDCSLHGISGQQIDCKRYARFIGIQLTGSVLLWTLINKRRTTYFMIGDDVCLNKNILFDRNITVFLVCNRWKILYFSPRTDRLNDPRSRRSKNITKWFQANAFRFEPIPSQEYAPLS